MAHFAFQCRGVENAAVALQTFDRILQTAPPAFNADAYAQATPLGPSATAPTVDTFARGQYIGPPAELRELVQPLVKATTQRDRDRRYDALLGDAEDVRVKGGPAALVG